MKLIRYCSYQIHRDTSVKISILLIHLCTNAAPRPPAKKEIKSNYSVNINKLILKLTQRRTWNVYLLRKAGTKKKDITQLEALQHDYKEPERASVCAVKKKRRTGNPESLLTLVLFLDAKTQRKCWSKHGFSTNDTELLTVGKQNDRGNAKCQAFSLFGAVDDLLWNTLAVSY